MQGSIEENTIHVAFTGVFGNGVTTSGDSSLTFRETTNPAQFDMILSMFVPRAGFSTQAVGLGGLAIVPAHHGRQDVLRTHPIDRNTPCIISREITIPSGKKTRLILDVSHDPRGDWNLVVKANGRTLHDSNIGPNTTKDGWKEIAVDLSKFAGQKVRLEVLNQVNDWRFEFGYWGQIAIVSGTGSKGSAFEKDPHSPKSRTIVRSIDKKTASVP